MVVGSVVIESATHFVDFNVLSNSWQLVWFKRDLRWQNHQPLYHAGRRGPVLGVYIVEEQWLQSPECSSFHLQFLKECLVELEDGLRAQGIPLLILRGEVLDLLAGLQKFLRISEIHSHEETGLWWTYQRDRRLKKWCAENGVNWSEYRQFAVIRGLKDRDRWNQQRNRIINSSLGVGALAQKWPAQEFWRNLKHRFSSRQISWQEIPVKDPRSEAQRGGRKQAILALESFLGQRSRNYRLGMSSPNTAFEQCSRLSSYLSWGVMSIAEVQAQLTDARKELQLQPYSEVKDWLSSLKSFESRLWWHCHFVQKLETEPELELENLNRGFDGMREQDFNESHFQAWTRGQTGYPIIDACMRALHREGWINFRMRAMLISFASYQLWLHWRRPAQHLARVFTDFEPGIHYSQVQMQSGVTGINAIRIYSPIKQSKDQDPQGEFIRRYCPELAAVDDAYIHEPHRMPPMIQQMAGIVIGRDYPEPIVEHAEAYREAKQRIFHWRSLPEVKRLAKRVYDKHGSRKNQFFPAQQRSRMFGNCGDGGR